MAKNKNKKTHHATTRPRLRKASAAVINNNALSYTELAKAGGAMAPPAPLVPLPLHLEV